ncbi:cuticle protein AMP1A [Procambarus clarkii]|uniref:cuticle protein AMP1A n=1 Tax=Procambarus clarkii TaxID=6728 RepID=UPI001E670268|nr:cuticle protein AMP1A-like [Procambarus clarkii]
MKLVLLALLVALAAAAPRPEKDAVTLVDDRSDSGDGNFQYNFETSNGIIEERTGTPGSKGQSNMQGSISFTFPDGTPALIVYQADENGFQPQSDLIPTPHPLPAHVHELIRIAEEQRAQGIVFEK